MKMRFNNTEYYDFIYGEDFDVSECEITSLEGAPEKIGGSFYCSDNLISSLEGYPYCSEDIDSDFNENESN